MSTHALRSMICATLLCAGAAVTLSAANLKVRLALTPVDTLPGVPVSIDLTVSNLSAKDLDISNRVVFVVTSANGSTNRLSVVVPTQFWNGDADPTSKYLIPAGGEIHLFMPVTEEFDSPLFAREGLNLPGEYDLVATVKGTSGAGADSNSAHLRVASVTGSDETIWKSISDERFTSIDVRAACSTTIRTYPQSRYYQLVSPFCVPFSTLDQFSHDVLQGSSALPGALQDAARFAVGRRYFDAAYNAYGQNNMALAGSISSAGRPIAQDLIDHPGSSFGPVAGAWLKKNLASEAEWRSFYALGHQRAEPSNVLPSVTCVADNGDGTFSADFGFSNPNDEYIEVPVGTENQVSPGPDNQGQPTDFAPGVKDSAFTVKGLTATTKWTLQGKTVKASIAQSPKCSDVKPSEPEP